MLFHTSAGQSTARPCPAAALPQAALAPPLRSALCGPLHPWHRPTAGKRVINRGREGEGRSESVRARGRREKLQNQSLVKVRLRPACLQRSRRHMSRISDKCISCGGCAVGAASGSVTRPTGAQLVRHGAKHGAEHRDRKHGLPGDAAGALGALLRPWKFFSNKFHSIGTRGGGAGGALRKQRNT